MIYLIKNTETGELRIEDCKDSKFWLDPNEIILETVDENDNLEIPIDE